LLGLFLGISLISIFEVISKIIKLMKEKYKDEEAGAEVINSRRIEIEPHDKLDFKSYLSSLQLSSTNARKVNEMDRRLFGGNMCSSVI
jgi:hypothetical protein